MDVATLIISIITLLISIISIIISGIAYHHTSALDSLSKTKEFYKEINKFLLMLEYETTHIQYNSSKNKYTFGIEYDEEALDREYIEVAAHINSFCLLYNVPSKKCKLLLKELLELSNDIQTHYLNEPEDLKREQSEEFTNKVRNCRKRVFDFIKKNGKETKCSATKRK